MKAYVVTSEDGADGDRSCVEFAKHNVVARREGAQYLDSEFEYVTCRRAAEFDDLAPGPVPPTVLIDHGWRFECRGCYQIVENDPYDRETGDPIEQDPVDYGDMVFCTPECKADFETKRDLAKRIETATLHWLGIELLKKMPGAEIADGADDFLRGHHVYVSDAKVQQARLAFRFPGWKYGNAHYSFNMKEDDGKMQLTVCAGDKDAFDRWRDAGYPAELSS